MINRRSFLVTTAGAVSIVLTGTMMSLGRPLDALVPKHPTFQMREIGQFGPHEYWDKWVMRWDVLFVDQFGSHQQYQIYKEFPTALDEDEEVVWRKWARMHMWRSIEEDGYEPSQFLLPGDSARRYVSHFEYVS